MYRILFAVLAVAALLGWGLSTAAAQQTDTSQSGTAGQAGASSQASPGTSSGTAVGPSAGQPTSGTAPAGTATADPAKIETYIQMRKYLQSQVYSVTPADLSKDRATIDRLLKSANRQWMTTDEFIQFHRQVQSDPALKAMVETKMAQESGAAPGASGTTGTSTGGAVSPSTTGAAPSSGAQPSASPK